MSDIQIFQGSCTLQLNVDDALFLDQDFFCQTLCFNEFNRRVFILERDFFKKRLLFLGQLRPGSEINGYNLVGLIEVRLNYRSYQSPAPYRAAWQ
jgi:hypothetical protein